MIVVEMKKIEELAETLEGFKKVLLAACLPPGFEHR